uniref:Amidohydrolase-related domain-containing protein n=1 Tax=Photinus pyralis TaxID=7054 RepID=A0A1Y1KB19_PHOPY
MEPNKLFISENIIVDNKFLNGGILVNNAGKITKVLRHHEIAPYKKCQNVEIIDVGTHVIMPGIVDSHVHVNEPGRTDWEGYETATRAAAAGGVTTIVDMPLNSIPPTTTLHNFKQKLKAAQGKVYVDVAFWGGVIPGNQVILAN